MCWFHRFNLYVVDYLFLIEVTKASKRAEDIQIRRLTRQVSALENQLKGARRGAGGMNRANSSMQGRANVEADKELKKQIKEMEVNKLHMLPFLSLLNVLVRL